MTLILSPGRRHASVSVLFAAILVGGLWAGLSAQTGRQFYVSPTGLPTNNGSIASPLNLDTALSSSGPVRAGDTVWLRGGVYRRSPGPAYNGATALYVSTLNGTAAAPILVRQYPGERATLDGNLGPNLPVLVVDGSYTWFWGFEITNSSPSRVSVRGAGIDTYGHHNRFINLVIHDTGQGVGFWATSQADDSEVYGSVISHVGWEGSDRGHGHSLYVQNVNGTKRITDNIMFEGFSFGVHAYTENGGIDNIAVTGNIVFNHGNLSVTGGHKANILFAGGAVAQNPTISGNVAYYPAGSAGRGVDVSACNNGRVENNYLTGGTPLRLSCTNTVVTGNTLYGPGTTPSGVFVAVRPNAYEPGRANIAVANWALSPAVQVALAGVNLPVGTNFEVRDALNFFAAPVVTGTYAGGPITLPMTGLTAAPPIGNVPIVPPHTAPQFGSFVLLPVGVALPPPVPPPPPPPSTPSPDGTQVPPAAQIVDGAGAVWTINGAAILRNGASAAGGTGVRILWSGGSIYVLGSTGGTWWKWTGSGWTNVGATQPGGSPPPNPPPPPPPSPPPAPAAPRIDSVTPTTGLALGGLTVTLAGAGFASPATVLVGGTPATAVVVPNSSTLSLVVPPHTPGPVDIVVTTAGQQVVRAAAFTYQPMAPVLRPVAINGSVVSLQWEAGPNTPVRLYGVVAGQSPGAIQFGPYPLGLSTSASANVAPGTYYLRVLADTDWGVLASNEVGFTVGLPGLPSPPTLSPASISGQTVSLSWTAVPGSGGYVLVARTTATGPPAGTLPVAGTSLSVAAPPGVYFVSVVAVNGYGVGAESNQIVVTVP